MDVVYQLTLALILILALFWLGRKERYKLTQQGLSPVYLGLIMITVCILFLYIPFYWVNTGVSSAFRSWMQQPGDLSLFAGALESAFNAIFMGVLEVPRHFALALEYEPATVTVGTQTLERYYPSQVMLWILAALGTASFVFMLARTLLNSMRLQLSRKRPIYYFSSLNEKSFILANSLYQESKDKRESDRPLLVFCQVDTGDENSTQIQYSAEAEEIGAIFEKDPVYSLKIKDPLRQQVRIFLMDENEDANILSLLRMEEQVCPAIPGRNQDVNTAQIPKSDIYVFSTHESTELIFDKTLQSFQELIRDRKMVPRYNFHLIDETRLIVQKLLLEHPLYEPLFYVSPQDGPPRPDADRNDQISVLAIGGGQLGMELVRGAMICGITDSYDFQIQVIDQNADALEKQFRYFSSYKECFESSEVSAEERKSNRIRLPDIFNGSDGIGASIKPVFHKADCRSTDFEEILDKYCIHSNYIVIATGDDELNISTARYLQRWYARQDIMRGMIPSRPPMIFAAIRSSERYEALHRLEDESAVHSVSKQLFLFGNNRDIFSAQGILSRPLDASAALFNSCYQYFEGDKLYIPALCAPIGKRQDMLYEVSKLPQVQQFSNQTVALHSLYKLQDLFFLSKKPKELLEYRYNQNRTQADTEGIFFMLAKLIRARGERLHRLEHRRWNLFQLLDGWECFPMEMIPDCRDQGYTPNQKKPHQLPLIKLHGCLVPFDDLDKLSELCGLDPQAFKGYDACMCTASLFAWLDLEASADHAQIIRDKLLAYARAKWDADVLLCTCDELLDLIIESFEPARQAFFR